MPPAIRRCVCLRIRRSNQQALTPNAGPPKLADLPISSRFHVNIIGQTA
jgi:hypothetical protein